MKKVTKIEALQKLNKKIKVAAYARVSSGKDAMLQSLASQINYYQKMIQSNDEWLFAGVYADEAVSGTKSDRAEFNRMIEDCKEGKIDLIITKAISRFARNTMTLLETVKELKKINVDVFFEEQNIYANSSEGEMVLTFLASFAQEEARSMSENMKWRIKKDFQEGVAWGIKDNYGYKVIDKKLYVVEEQAKVVKRIFEMYVNGCGIQMICNTLNDEDIKPLNSNKWARSTINQVITNNNYTGDLVLQKTYRKDYMCKRHSLNKGELNKYVVEDNHEPIISKELFERAAEVRRQRILKYRVDENHPTTSYPFTSKLTCGICGCNFIHKTTPYTKKWYCTTFAHNGKKACASKAIPDSELERLALEFVDEISADAIERTFEKIVINPNNEVVFYLRSGKVEVRYWKDKSRKDSWTPEKRERARQQTLSNGTYLNFKGGKQKCLKSE